jgi:hypothetical protein
VTAGHLYVAGDSAGGTLTLLAREKGLDVEAVVVPDDHQTSVPPALGQAIAFFRQH